MTARRAGYRTRPMRQKIGSLICFAFGMGLICATAFAWRQNALRRWKMEREKTENIRQLEFREAERARQRQILNLQAAWNRTSTASQPHYELLQTLARITPSAIVLRQLRCDAVGFCLRGHVDEHMDRPDSPLLQFCRDLAQPTAPWRFQSSPEITADDFTCRGVFRTKPPYPDADRGTEAVAPPNGRDAAAAGEWEARLSSARTALLTPKDFDKSSENWNHNWTLLAQSTEPCLDVELRHYTWAYKHPALKAWSDILQTIRQVCAEPGVTIDALVLATAPDGGDSFTQAQINLTVRLRP
jgi:hypothetical protein